jgi:formate hydrogenlyase subunit 6/NADH:ubiquinone oxidoreductase subunit I
MKKRSTNSITIKFPKVQAKCECGCYSSVHAVAQMVGEHCIGCKACTGWKPSMPVSK